MLIKISFQPKGREFGTVKIERKRSDPLFSGLGKNFKAQENHVCMISKLPHGAQVLASSDLCQIQCIAIGDKIRLVQFHPERRHHQTQAILQEVREDTPKGQKEYQTFLKSIKNTSKTDNLIIKNFLNYFVYTQQ